jgi:hypothetical protein
MLNNLDEISSIILEYSRIVINDVYSKNKFVS